MTNANPRPVVLITGAASGIGYELARQLAAAGSTIAAIDRNAVALQALETTLAPNVACAVADVTDRVSLQAAVAALEAKLGVIDSLIASAGVGRESSGVHFAPA